MSNIFGHLPVYEEEIDHIKNEKKARKKIKAINNLKKKERLTDEEQNKVDSEDYWQRILNPFYENMEKQKENKIREQQWVNKKREQRQKEAEQKQKESEQRQQRESEQRQRQREFEQRQRQREFEQREREFEQRQRQRESEQRQGESEQRQRQKEFEQKQEPKEFKSKHEKQIYIEFNLLLAKGNTIKKAKHNLLLKYHPDKNKENLATEMTQIINNITIVKNKIYK